MWDFLKSLNPKSLNDFKLSREIFQNLKKNLKNKKKIELRLFLNPYQLNQHMYNQYLKLVARRCSVKKEF